MWKEFLAIVFGIGVVVFAVAFFYSQLPGEPIELEIVNNQEDAEEYIEPGLTPVFAKNLRFNHNLISYYIEPECSENRKQKMKRAFAIFHDKMRIISFYEKQNRNADILVGCSKDYLNMEDGGGMFIAGEGGPSKYLNGSLFNVILEGKIMLYKKTECDYLVVELHELLHVFGFNHVNNPKSLMYNVSKCEQRITPDMVEYINSLYSIAPLPDVHIEELNVLKKGRYLDFNVSVKNQGLVDAGDVVLNVSSESGDIEEFEIKNLTIYGLRTLSVRNLKLPSRFDEKITFNVSIAGDLEEIDFGNNAVSAFVGD